MGRVPDYQSQDRGLDPRTGRLRSFRQKGHLFLCGVGKWQVACKEHVSIGPGTRLRELVVVMQSTGNTVETANNNNKTMNINMY